MGCAVVVGCDVVVGVVVGGDGVSVGSGEGLVSMTFAAPSAGSESINTRCLFCSAAVCAVA